MTTPPSTPGPRGCHGTNKAGAPCGAHPLPGTKLCGVHTPGHAIARHFAPGHPVHPGAGRPSKIDQWRQAVLEEFEIWVAPYRAAVTSAVLTTTFEGRVHVSNVPDLAARIAAAEKVFNRLFGMPGQPIEFSGRVDGQIDLSGLSLEEKRLARELLLRATGATEEAA